MTNLSESEGRANLSPDRKRALLARLLERKAKEATEPEIREEYYRFELYPEYRQLSEQLASIESLGRGNPFFRTSRGHQSRYDHH